MLWKQVVLKSTYPRLKRFRREGGEGRSSRYQFQDLSRKEIQQKGRGVGFHNCNIPAGEGEWGRGAVIF